ncbi:MAG: bifunctional phosphoglucose/phosphomannose isomerase [Candidatus Geothermarchaeales archaeon]
MLTPDEVREIDKSGLYLKYEKWPSYFLETLSADVQAPEASDVDRIIFAGMGGSGVVGDVMRDWLSHVQEKPLDVVKDYHLPRIADEETLTLILSYSGNTEEALSIIHEALSRGSKLATISSGGLAERICLKMKIPHTKIRGGLPPRAGFPLLFGCAALVLQRSGAIDGLEDQLHESYKFIEEVGGALTPEAGLEQNPAKKLALWIHGSLPIIYGSGLNRSVALRFKESLNENAKMHAIADALPELCHNDLVAWEKELDMPRRAVFVRFRGEPPEIRERFEAVREQIEKYGSSVYEVWPPGEDLLSKMLSAIYTLDFTSIYLAILRGIDPTPTESIDEMKARLKAKLRYLEKYTDLPLR